MKRLIAAIGLVLAVIYIVPFVVYGLVSVFTGLRPPEGGSPLAFLLGVFVSKIGTAIAFVLILDLAWPVLERRWLAYAVVWWLMYVFGEIGQAIGPNYGTTEAIAGIVSETIYWPAAGWLAHRILRAPVSAATSDRATLSEAHLARGG